MINHPQPKPKQQTPFERTFDEFADAPNECSNCSEPVSNPVKEYSFDWWVPKLPK